jgi:glycosyltransferase involved in cell wall biosynthesis
MKDPQGAPFVSICIPVRNGQEELGHTLSNLLIHSAYPPDRFEVVLGDHDSTDGTSSIIASFRARFPQLRSIHVPFSGPNRAHVRNRLICESKGELLIFVDHDVLVSDNFISKHVDAHVRFRRSLVAGAILGISLDRGMTHLLSDLNLDHISASYPLLSGNPELADPRIRRGLVPGGSDSVSVTDTPAPFRLFWGGNLSAFRSDIDACGCFDEAYEGWGLEDDDFAQQFRVRGRGLTFSAAAWAFHLPGLADRWSQLAQWWQNFETFFRKFSTREIESYSFYGSDLLPGGMRRLDGLASALKQVDISTTLQRARQHLSSPQGRRLGHLIADSDLAHALELTDALCPFGPPTTTHHYDGRTHWWPFVGLKTPFANQEIDEVIVLVEVLMWLDRYMLTLILGEAARVARSAVFVCSAEAETRGGGLPFRVFREITSALRFASASWINV